MGERSAAAFSATTVAINAVNNIIVVSVVVVVVIKYVVVVVAVDIAVGISLIISIQEANPGENKRRKHE
jgi:hypothetical protein